MHWTRQRRIRARSFWRVCASAAKKRSAWTEPVEARWSVGEPGATAGAVAATVTAAEGEKRALRLVA